MQGKLFAGPGPSPCNNMRDHGWHCQGDEGYQRRCYASPPVLTSHAGCSSVCEQHALSTHGASATAGLAFVGERATSEFLRQNVLNGHRHWIGLHRVLPSHQGVQGLGAAAMHGFTSWAAELGSAAQDLGAQGSVHVPPDWTNWAASQPDGAMGREDCVGIDGRRAR